MSEIEIAKKTRKMAYAPYSEYQVGAVLIGKSGKMYTGCNVENYGIQSICAERVAFTKAISEGEREFQKIVIVGGKKGDHLEECLPCGYCRQFMSEFVEKNFKIITWKGEREQEYSMDQLLPYGFKL